MWVHSLDAGNDRGGLLIPFRLAAKAANLGLCMYSPQECELEWLGGAPALAALFPEASMSLSEVVRRVHPDDRGALRRLVRSTAARTPGSGCGSLPSAMAGTFSSAGPVGSFWGLAALSGSSE